MLTMNRGDHTGSLTCLPRVTFAPAPAWPVKDRAGAMGSPVQRVVLHPQVVPGEVSGWVAQVVVLVPEDALAPGRGGDDLHLDRQLHCGGLFCTTV